MSFLERREIFQLQTRNSAFLSSCAWLCHSPLVKPWASYFLSVIFLIFLIFFWDKRCWKLLIPCYFLEQLLNKCSHFCSSWWCWQVLLSHRSRYSNGIYSKIYLYPIFKITLLILNIHFVRKRPFGCWKSPKENILAFVWMSWMES